MARVIEFYIPTNFRRKVASVPRVATRKSDRVLPTGEEIRVARPSCTANHSQACPRPKKVPDLIYQVVPRLLATVEKALLAFPPIRRTVPITNTLG